MSMLALRLLPLVITLMFPALASAMSPEEVPNPQERREWVADEANLLDAFHRESINRALTQLEADTGIEIAVVTVESVDSPTPKDFTTELFNHWGVGKAEENNGLLIVLVSEERRLEMETGYGLEGVLTDGWLKVMQERDMVPRFREGNFAAGLTAGVFALDRRLRSEANFGSHTTPGSRDPAPEPPTKPAPTRSSQGTPWWVWLLGAGGIAGFVARARWLQTCPKCKSTMRILEEYEEDGYLHEGQETEEKIGSMNYDVYECENCGVQRIHANSGWFSGYANCPECKNRTLASRDEILSHPTYDSTGRKRVTVDCAHCPYTHTYTTTIPRRTRPKPSPSRSSSDDDDDSSSFGGGGGSYSGGGGSSSRRSKSSSRRRGGGGSFGGGSSGGGGAGSSW
ncbi:TPM domain-containing protein [Lujinxingia vulgaris]|uniref:TPM domain-containing protein n=1 Tax=Lujinxingia vulgaris TaxID=2600176 RepID=A0A5C6XPZ4_9DELT|nr:TPM domain-containing protein [Lujinxingia vulgaris]TXD39798.1 TPM domain-containing protein [Lujinxingia vulgaris]